MEGNLVCKQWVSRERVKDILSGDIADCILLDEHSEPPSKADHVIDKYLGKDLLDNPQDIDLEGNENA